MQLFYANTFSSYLLPLQKMAKWSSQHNGKYPDPYSKLKFNDEKKKEKKKKKNKNRDREHNRENKILSQIDSNANKVRNNFLQRTNLRDDMLNFQFIEIIL